jgi:hypothetical protein
MQPAESANIVDEIMLEFGSYTCADVSLETVQIVHIPEEISFNYKLACDMWANFRRSDNMIDKYGFVQGNPPTLSAELTEWYTKNIIPAFERFIKVGTDVEGPYYLCMCRESGDEYFIRRALPDDKFTRGKFMTVDCQFSKMSDCVPRNKLAGVRTTDGEYLLFVIHKPGSMEDQEKLRMMLDQYSIEGKFALL